MAETEPDPVNTVKFYGVNEESVSFDRVKAFLGKYAIKCDNMIFDDSHRYVFDDPTMPEPAYELSENILKLLRKKGVTPENLPEEHFEDWLIVTDEYDAKSKETIRVGYYNGERYDNLTLVDNPDK